MAESLHPAAPVPTLKVILALAAILSIPVGTIWAKKLFEKNIWSIRIAWVLAFLTNFVTVSLPGRFDSEAGKKGFPWVTLFEPAAWAFSIWGVIYIGELLVTLYVAGVTEPVGIIRKATPFWIAGNLFQSLWCLTFRPEFRSVMWLPMSLLALGSASFFGAHQAISSGLDKASGWGLKSLLLALRFPISLHTAWLAAATCLNLNGWAVMEKASYPVQIGLAFTTAFLGGLLGIVSTLYAWDPLLGGTIAWALAALSQRTALKVDQNVIPYISADTQTALSLVEAMLSVVLQALAFGVLGSEVLKNLWKL